MEVGAQWAAVVSAGPCGPLCSANLAVSPAVGLSSFGDHVRVLHDVVVDLSLAPHLLSCWSWCS